MSNYGNEHKHDCFKRLSVCSSRCSQSCCRAGVDMGGTLHRKGDRLHGSSQFERVSDRNVALRQAGTTSHSPARQS